MLELAIFQTGPTDLPSVAAEGIRVNAGTLAETHESFQRQVVTQVRQGILAEELGFNYCFPTEHHFQPEGVEFSPNPLFAGMAIAARTKRIRLGQMANILSWHHPIRLAEQAAMLDVFSGGRLEFGVGRGYQSRETETLGGPLGTTVQDQERNRAFFDEAFQIVLKAWTEPSFSHQGEFFSLPPTYTKWNHSQTMAYFNQPQVERSVDDVLNVGPPDMYSMGAPVYASTTTLKQISVYPQPLQKPHPQIWQPVTSPRSIDWAAAKGVNCFTIPEPNSRLKVNVDRYYEQLDKRGWPDRLNRKGPFKFGWDSEVRRGFTPARFIHVLPRGKEKEDLQRYKEGLENTWQFFAPFGFGSILADADEPPFPPDMKITADLTIEKEVVIVGTADEVVEKILKVKETVGYDDFLFTGEFEMGGFSGQETEEQMRMFAADCVPQLAKACGGLKVNPEVAPNLEVGVPAAVS